VLEALQRLASKFLSMARKEIETIEELHGDVRAAIERMEAKDPGLKPLLEEAHAYAVFPSIGRATAVVGGAFGKGEVIRNGRVIGYAAVGQLTLGVQLGGDTFSEIIAFQDKAALDRFKEGRYAFAANASAVLVKAGAAASANYETGAAVFVLPQGGMMLELAIGAQKFWFRPAVLGRAKRAPASKAKSVKQSGTRSATRPPRPRAPARKKPKTTSRR
jgi:lipid-binding SYLF domain-containing protein